MRLYRGNAHWLYQQLKRNYVEIYRNEVGLMPYSEFKTKVENGSEFWFAGSSYKLSENDSSTGKPIYKNDTFSI